MGEGTLGGDLIDLYGEVAEKANCRDWLPAVV
jgi:hypothetical protein